MLRYRVAILVAVILCFLSLASVTAAQNAPVAVSATPNSGTGATQTFTFVYSDADGYQDMWATQVMFNTGSAYANGCATYYNQPSNQIYLMSDQGYSWLGPITLGASGTLQNSQCTLDAGASSASGVGNTLTVNLAFTFNSSFLGKQRIMMYAEDTRALDTGGWQIRGTWTPIFSSDQPPSATSVTIGFSSGSTQTFTFDYSDVNGYRYMWNTQTMFNTGTSYTNGCATYYAQGDNRIYLMDDAGHNWLGPLTLGTPGTLSNSQCTVDAGASWAFGSGDNLSVILALTFSSSFTASQTIYMYAMDPYGLETGWQIGGTFTPSAPRITSVSPNSASVGSTVTITGANFGATQGSGNIWLGSSYATVATWSDTQIQATVASGSTTGVAKVFQGGNWSNNVLFTVNTPRPSINGVSPNNGVPGTQVTITGSGFGAPESGSVYIGTAAGIVTSWSDTSIVASVAAGSTSGAVQVIQSGAASDALPFTVNIPHIGTVSPTRGVGGTLVTLTGSGFGATQGDSTVYLGTTPGAVVTWSDNTITANVDSNAASGVAKVIRGGLSSNSITFTVPPHWESASINIYPNLMTMLVGESRPLQSLYNNGLPVTGLVWTTSDPGIASLSMDDPPVLTANNPGHVTITAGDSSADVTVLAGDSLPLGSIKWSNPGDGSGVSSIVPAVPSATGVADVFAAQNSGDVHALRADGTVAWIARGIDNQYWIPDFKGGVVVIDYDNNLIHSLDGITGQPGPSYTFNSLSGYADMVGHTDGTVFTWDGDKFIALDPSTGTVKASVSMDHTTWDSESGRQIDQNPFVEHAADQFIPDLIIGGDGFAYLSYKYQTVTSNYVPGQSITAHNDSFIKVIKLGTDGTSSKFTVGHWSSDYSLSFPSTAWVPQGAWYCDTNCVAASLASAIAYDPACAVKNSCAGSGGIKVCDVDTGCTTYVSQTKQTGYSPFIIDTSDAWRQVVWFHNLITNADQGVLFAYNLVVPQHFDGSANVPQSNKIVFSLIGSNGVQSNTIDTPDVTWFTPAVQRQDSSYVGSIGTYTNTYNWNSSLAAFASNGQMLWNVPGPYSPQIATADGGVIASSWVGDSQTYMQFDQNGRASGQMTSSPLQSWTGNAYGYGSVDLLESGVVPVGEWYSAAAEGNPSKNGTAAKDELYPPLDQTQQNAIWNAYIDFVTTQLSNTTCAGLADYWVFSHFKDVNAYQIDKSLYINYFAQNGGSPHFVNGARSLLDPAKLRISFSGTKTLKDYFAQQGNSLKALAEPGSFPLTIYWNPSAIGTSNNGVTVENEARFFHESLHGITGLPDYRLTLPSLELTLHALDPTTIILGESSSEITDYLMNHVLSYCPVGESPQ